MWSSSDLPLDIDHAKLLQYLLDRRLVSKTYGPSLKAAKIFLRSAASTLPEASAIPAPTTHGALLRALATLADTSLAPPFPAARDTDILNRYTHPTSRAWTSARVAYETGGAHLAEAAQILVRACEDAAVMKRERTRLVEVVQDAGRREGGVARGAAEARERFRSAFDGMGVGEEGDFEVAIAEKVRFRAPEVLRRAVEVARAGQVGIALQYYRDFVDYAGEGEGEAFCEKLKEVLEGDLEEIIGEVPEAGLGSVDLKGAEAREINWEGMMSSERGLKAGGGDDVVGNGADIDWGIEIDGAGDAAADDNSGGDFTVGDSDADVGSGGGIDSGDCASPSLPADLCVGGTASQVLSLSDASTRSQYANDLLELSSFLTQRGVELERAFACTASLELMQSGDVPDTIRNVDASAVGKLLDAVADATFAIAGDGPSRVLMLQGSLKAVAKAARELGEKKHAATRMDTSVGGLARRKEAAKAELRVLGPKFEEMRRDMRNLLRETEQKIAKLCKGKEVHILGEINIIFPADDE